MNTEMPLFSHLEKLLLKISLFNLYSYCILAWLTDKGKINKLLIVVGIDLEQNVCEKPLLLLSMTQNTDITSFQYKKINSERVFKF